MNKTLTQEEYWLSSTFKEIFKGIEPSSEIPSGEFITLSKTTQDSEIIKQAGIMSKEDCLAILIDLTQKQKNGEKGSLLINGYSNIIGYVNHNQTILAVYCDWGSGDQEWRCISNDLSEWCADHRFWSRNGVPKTLDSDDSLKNKVEKMEKFLSETFKDFQV